MRQWHEKLILWIVRFASTKPDLPGLAHPMRFFDGCSIVCKVMTNAVLCDTAGCTRDWRIVATTSILNDPAPFLFFLFLFGSFSGPFLLLRFLLVPRFFNKKKVLASGCSTHSARNR